ncbi:MAG: hypothetical protein ABI779_23055 [Acidobacteriota bacterium]
MHKTEQPKGKPLTVPLIAIGAAIALFAAIPFFLSHAEPASPPTAQVAVSEAAPPVSVLGGRMVFRDPKAQAREFVGYYHTIALTPEQEAIKKAALVPMPAACCRESSAYACCCPCNLSKTVWGLSNVAISKYGANAKDVQQVVQSWLGYVNPANGFTGDSCYRGGCSNPAHRGGCAGMEESKLDV